MLCTIVRAFIAMKLQKVDLHLLHHVCDVLPTGIHEQGNCGDERRELRHDMAGLLHTDISRTRRVKHKTQRIGTGIYGGHGVLNAGDATYLDSGSHNGKL